MRRQRLAMVCLVGLFCVPACKRQEPQETVLYRVKPVEYWLEQLDSPQLSRRLAALEALEEYGAEARAATPRLLEALQAESVEVRLFAASSLGKVAPGSAEVVAGLGAALGDPEVSVRSLAAHALLGLEHERPLPIELVHDILAILESPWMVRGELGRVLGPPGGDAALSACVQGLHSPYRSLREGAVRSLLDSGDAAVPVLLEAFRDPDPEVRETVLDMVHGLSLEQAEESFLRVLRQEPSPFARFDAIMRLSELAPQDAAAVQVLAQVLEHEPYHLVREVTARTLGWMHVRPEEAADVLFGAFRDPDNDVRRDAVGGLVQLGEPVLDEVVERLQDPDPRIRRLALAVLRELGPEARDALSAVEALSSDPAPEVRESIAGTLSQIRTGKPPERRELKRRSWLPWMGGGAAIVLLALAARRRRRRTGEPR